MKIADNYKNTRNEEEMLEKGVCIR